MTHNKTNKGIVLLWNNIVCHWNHSEKRKFSDQPFLVNFSEQFFLSVIVRINLFLYVWIKWIIWLDMPRLIGEESDGVKVRLIK